TTTDTPALVIEETAFVATLGQDCYFLARLFRYPEERRLSSRRKRRPEPNTKCNRERNGCDKESSTESGNPDHPALHLEPGPLAGGGLFPRETLAPSGSGNHAARCVHYTDKQGRRDRDCGCEGRHRFRKGRRDAAGSGTESTDPRCGHAESRLASQRIPEGSCSLDNRQLG